VGARATFLTLKANYNITATFKRPVFLSPSNSLALYGFTPAGHPQRPYQECLKNALDDANNNKNFVQLAPCDVNYSGLETPCLVP
jgi:hypothetical protein